MIHSNIGEKIKEVFEARQMKLKDFAEGIGVARQNIYRIFTKDSIDTNLLIKISSVLDYNFFQYFNPNKETQEKENAGLSVALEETRKELELCRHELKLAKKEIDYLKKIIDLMEEKTRLILGKAL